MSQHNDLDPAPMLHASQGTPAPRRRPGFPTLGPIRKSLQRSFRPSLLITALAAAACSDVTGVGEIRSEMLPPTSYQVLWDRVEDCSGRSGNFEDLSWFWVHSFPEESNALGQWNERHEITLALAAVGNRVVVAHELLHELLDGDPAHADPAWEACGIPRGGT